MRCLACVILIVLYLGDSVVPGLCDVNIVFRRQCGAWMLTTLYLGDSVMPGLCDVNIVVFRGQCDVDNIVFRR